MKEQYKYLLADDMPKMIKEGIKLLDTKESPGSINNPVIIGWAKELGGNIDDIYNADEIPWCGLAQAIVAKRADKEVVKDPLWALNWSTFGDYVKIPMIGDTLVFVRKTSTGSTAGHVGIYVGEDNTAYHVLGGNQSDAYNITRVLKNRLYAARRPKYKIGQPSSVKQMILKNDGTPVSKNEQ